MIIQDCWIAVYRRTIEQRVSKPFSTMKYQAPLWQMRRIYSSTNEKDSWLVSAERKFHWHL